MVLSEWTTEPGRRVARGEVVAVVETEKAVVEVESDRGGIVLRLLADEGSSVSVGAPLALLGTEEELGTDLDGILAELGIAGSPPAPRRHLRRHEETPLSPSPSPSPSPLDPAGGARLFVSPIARKLLKRRRGVPGRDRRDGPERADPASRRGARHPGRP